MYGTEFWKISRTFPNKMQDIQEKLLEVAHFILRGSRKFP